MPSRQTTSKGIARSGIRVQKVTPPARKRPLPALLSRPASQASRSTAKGRVASKLAASQTSSQADSAACIAARVRRSRSSVGSKQAASKARTRAAQARGVAAVADSAHQSPRRCSRLASAPTAAASRPPISS